MTARALAKLGLAPIPHIDLPVGLRPQLVNEAGYEVDAEELVRDDADALIPDADDVDAEIGDAEVDAEEDTITHDIGHDPGQEHELGEPLLSLADSLALPFSLTQTRQRHLTHLLPHIFSHPPIPSHSRPRARPPPKGTFLFPTPAPAEPPLPLKEYHAPTKALPSASSAPLPPGSPAPGTLGISDPAGPSRPQKPKAKGKERSIAPAHEIECIARVTLSIGPVSYPGTEVWMGRFVNPRADQPNGPRRRERVETPGGAVPKKRKHEGTVSSVAKEKKKHLPAIAGMSVKPGPTPSFRPPRPPVAGPSRPPGTPSAPASATPATRPPPASSSAGRPPGAAPVRPPIEPDLIQRVNQAATQHPWLSVIIHKAARNTASKEELAKLGRIVARLGKGEGVGEGPLDGLPPTPGSTSTSAPATAASRPPPSTASKLEVKPTAVAAGSAKTSGPALNIVSGPPSSSATPAPKTATPRPPATAAPEPTDDDSSDDDLDMTGEPQTGGGPIDPELLPDVAKPSNSIPTAPVPSPAAGLASSSSVLATQTPSTVKSVPVSPATQATTPVLASVAAGQSEVKPSGPVSAVVPVAQGTPAVPGSTPAGSAATAPAAPVAPLIAPPPPPNRIYPLPPPFLLIAFKETPTEKFLLPLGSQSYVSRIGSPALAKTPSAPNAAAANPAPGPDSTTATETLEPEAAAVAEAPMPVASSGRGRTRQSLGRAATKPPAMKKEESKAAVQPKDVDKAQSTGAIPPPAPREPPRSGLPPLPGVSPPKGTVLLSTVIPVDDWLKPDWDKLAQRMPFYSKAYDEAVVPVHPGPGAADNNNDATGGGTDPSKVPRSPKTRMRVPPSPRSHRRSETAVQAANERKIDPNTLLNMGAESFMPPEGDVRAVTIRLEGVDDAAWNKMRWVMDHVDGVEMKALGAARPDLLEASAPVPVNAANASPAMASAIVNSAVPMPTPPTTTTTTPTTNTPTGVSAPPRPPVPRPFDPSLHPRLREAYDEYRRHRIQHLLSRVARRTFPKFRLPGPRTDLKDALSDRWAPRRCPMSTRPLYLTSPPPEGAEDEEEEILPQPKRKRGQAEEEVMFEMPVSLDMLDERVEAGAKKSVNRRVGKLKLGKTKEPKLTLSGRPKNVGKRSRPGMVCEGCARTDQKVWRKGPGGKGTLCNECGDKYNAGTLGDLLAPGAASAAREEGENETEVKAEESDQAGRTDVDTPATPTEPPAMAQTAEATEPKEREVGSQRLASGEMGEGDAATKEHTPASESGKAEGGQEASGIVQPEAAVRGEEAGRETAMERTADGET